MLIQLVPVILFLLALPVLFSLVFFTSHSSPRSAPASPGMGAYDLWRRQNGANTCTDAVSPTSFSFWTNPLSLGVSVLRLQ